MSKHKEIAKLGIYDTAACCKYTTADHPYQTLKSPTFNTKDPFIKMCGMFRYVLCKARCTVTPAVAWLELM